MSTLTSCPPPLFSACPRSRLAGFPPRNPWFIGNVTEVNQSSPGGRGSHPRSSIHPMDSNQEPISVWVLIFFRHFFFSLVSCRIC